MRFLIYVLAVFLAVSPVSEGFAQKEKIVYDFEEGQEGWVIPGWSYDQYNLRTYKGKSVGVSDEMASSGTHSLELIADMPGVEWSCAIVEKEKQLDLTGYETVSVDVYVPKGAPSLLQAQIVLTVGDARRFTEMRKAVPLKPGQWTTITARLESPVVGGDEGEEPPLGDFRGRGPRRLYKFIDNIKKVAVRIEYNAAPPNMIGPRYKGPVYVDNFVIE